MTCPFCNPTQRILKENEHAYVVLSNPRKVEGHFLIIPKRHIENPIDITNDELISIFDLIRFVQGKLLNSMGKGMRVQQNYMPFLPESNVKVAHVHYHVIPLNFKDRLWQVVDVHDSEMFEDLSQEEHDRIAKLLE